ncbi:MAG: YadA C-terminal domain-containing protein, partial [Alphaproteobacteria bacterium]|nr:YadA C-terminal domain-containing protein [Alphaproteobacteria bacterium]
VDAEETAAAEAMTGYTTDAGKLATLNASYESLQEAKANFNHDSVNYAEVQTAQAIMAKSIKATISDANEEVHGKIHGLITEENGAKKFNGTGKVASTRLDEDGNYVGDLAVGTTTEEHLVSLDNAIGAEVDRAKAAESALRSDLATTDAKVNALEKNVSGGVAAATALSAVEVSNVKKGEMSVGGGYGYYNSQSAMALGAALGLSDNWSVNAGAGIASGDKTQVSFRAGTNYKFKLF